jgi:tripartite ATP-independent transporter DctM subunit
MVAIGLSGMLVFLVLIGLRMPIAIAMMTVGVCGSLYLNGWDATLYVIGGLPFTSVFPYSLSVIPLFIFMGTLALHSGMSRSLYDAGSAAFGHWKGGLSMGTIAACAGFGAICGSSLATTATMGRISIPEMTQRGYQRGFSAAAVAAGGTLGVLIPPSIILVIYAMLTEQSIGRLFVASIIPGVMATLLYICAISITVYLNPQLAPEKETIPKSQRLKLLFGAWPVLVVFTIVLGGLFAGFFSPTEAASVGVIGVALIGFIRKELTLPVLKQTAKETATLSGMIFFILIGASIFNYFIEATQISHSLVDFISSSGLHTGIIILIIIMMYIALGCFMDSVSMIFLTIPFVFPIIDNLGLDPIWFGILLLSVVEIGLITPPVGMNLFVVQASIPGLKIKEIYRAIIPFLIADTLRLILVATLPIISLFLVSLLYP